MESLILEPRFPNTLAPGKSISNWENVLFWTLPDSIKNYDLLDMKALDH